MTPPIQGLYSPQEAEAMLAVYERDKRGDLSGAIPSLAQCFVDRSARIGCGVKVWHCARVLADVVLGDDVMIGGGTEIGRGSIIGNGTRIQANCFLPSHSQIGARVFIGPNVVFTDDRYPCVHLPNDPPYVAMPPVVEDHASIGAGAVILPGVRIGRGARVAAGAVVTEDVPAFTMALGVPAREKPVPEGWTDGPANAWPPDFP